MAHVEVFRPLIEARAAGACEYCRLLQAATGMTFHIEHITPLSKGGAGDMNNLALSCPGCNLAKAGRIVGEDTAGKTQPLFNPRAYTPPLLGWHLHFTLDHMSGLILPRSAIAEATVKTLRINEAVRVFARRLQITAGLIS